jgi:ATP-dependent 26S proteasome regulatory subunit
MVGTFMDAIDSSKNYVTRMVLFNQIKTGDPIIDAFLTTFILGIFSWFVNWIYENQHDFMPKRLTLDDLKYAFYKKNTIVIEGQRSSVSSCYSYTQNISSAYSNRFKAIWNHIIKNVEYNKTIYKIKEDHTNYQSSAINNIDDRRKNTDLFMVYQTNHFLLDPCIYVKAEIEKESEKNEKEKMNVTVDKIIINIYSYKYSISELISYIDSITEKYLDSIKDARTNKKFIYSLEKVELTSEDSQLDCWREDLFESSRTFNNIFFDGKKQIIEKIDFFINNRDWYDKKGIPYSIGIGLHGPPGTGKTSFIKALANYTNRHIIVLSLKLIKTKAQLEKLFFENTYNENNEHSSISWDKKILVFEDIDCIGDIILNREERKRRSDKKNRSRCRRKIEGSGKGNENKGKKGNKENKGKEGEGRGTDDIDSDSIKVTDIIQTICELNETPTAMSSNKEQLITLDDILNLWDGIRETPGRMLIISSNHYDKLDPALVRPGRIDITHELSNASHNTISEIYTHLFGSKIDEHKLSKVKQYFYSPAEIINMYVSNKNEKDFINRLVENKRI